MSLFKTFKVKNNEIFLSNGLIAVSVYIVFNTLVTDQLKVSEGGSVLVTVVAWITEV